MNKFPVPALLKRRNGLFQSLHLVALAAISLLALTGATLTRQVDLTNRTREEHLVNEGMGQRIDELADVVVPQVDWDDAVTHIDNSFEPAWIDRNLASYLHVMNGIRGVFVLGGNGDRLIYAARDGKRAALGSFAPYAATVRALMPELRANEQARPPFAPDSAHAHLVARPIQARALTMAAGRLDVVVLSLVQPDFGTALPRHARSPVVVTVLPFDKDEMWRLAARYELDDLRLATGPTDDRHWSQAPLRDQADRVIAVLQWRDRAVGQSLMLRLLAPLLCMLSVLGAIAGLLFRRSDAIASDLIASEARARHLAFHDSLTQLPNRAMMFERMRVALASARRRGTTVAVHCLDLDRFKGVNDSLGHLAGDQLICRVAEIVAGLCRESDTVARLGGDEFVVIQPDSSAIGAAHLAERLIGAIREPIELEYGVVEVGVSIGTTLVTAGEGGGLATDPSEALRQADLALYESKERGRGCATFFEPEMDAAMRFRRELEVDLRHALATDALEMVYQPQSDVRGNLVGVEALVRWNHPVRGAVPPAMFVPLAEESGLILELGERVFRRVFEETRDWDLRVAVNVSALQLRSPKFMGVLTQLAGEFRIDASQYEIEITETALLGDDGVTRNNIIMLKQEGFTIALDDFGTGYSSLSTLQRFEVDTIKIDRSFVRNLGIDAEADALVDAIIQLGRALKLTVVAEGVETESQRLHLARCGCNVFQGYLLNRPVAASEAALLAA